MKDFTGMPIIENKTKNLTNEDIWKKFNRKSDSEKVSCLWEAMSMKEQYNGRDNTTCIALAMGYDEDWVENERIWNKLTFA